MTDADGIAEFDTIYPGYYHGRPMHLHFKVHVGNKAFLTSQALFPEEWNARIMAMAPYNEPRSSTRPLNGSDPFFIGNAGEFRIVRARRRSPGSDEPAYRRIVRLPTGHGRFPRAAFPGDVRPRISEF